MSKFQAFWNLAPDASHPEILNMYVYGAIMASSHWLFGSETDVVASQFVKDLRQYPNATRINVYINSPGGNVFAAAAIKNQLSSHKAEVHSYIDGLCASAAVGLAMGASVVHMSRSALIMIHNPSTRIEGEAKDLQKGIEFLQKVKTTIISIYQEKTALPEDKLIALMDEETWLTADEALAMGFIDNIVEDDGLDVTNNEDSLVVNGVTFDFMSSMQVDGHTFYNKISRERLEEKLSDVKKAQGGNVTMDFEQIMNAMTPEQRATFDAQLQVQITEAVSAEQSIWATKETELNAQIQNLTEQLTLAQKPADPPATIDEDAVLANLSEDVRNYVQSLKTTAEALQAQLQEAATTAAFNAFKENMSVYAALPIKDEQLQALYKLSVNDTANFQHVEALLKVANAAMEAGFTSIGNDNGKPAPTNATEAMNAKIAQLQDENPKMDYNTALKQVADANPTLYQQYRSDLS